MRHATFEELQAGLDAVRSAPPQVGSLELIVRRPARGEREILPTATLDARQGLVGDRWRPRGAADPDSEHQVMVMSARMAALVAGSDDVERWAQAGDQLYLDFDISEANLPVGSRLAVGEVVLEVNATPHTGCGKFIRRFGADSMKLISSPVGRELRLRGACMRVVEPGTVTRGDAVSKIGG
jgi:hypothetical protein